MLEFFCDGMAIDTNHLWAVVSLFVAPFASALDETYHKILPNHDKRLIFKQSPALDCVVPD
ncbi:hypothetical protein [Herbaspirillum sp.]|uniref:hypothetical protein n=1 Tax=Herbaspirillum sp. TaxID=1890675 RepID=UPI001B14FD75|nr:hypothetical protein [Herbaspirillum sp.]MBO9537457.1 hypothetical protein [Herbaspirillum sp.]